MKRKKPVAALYFLWILMITFFLPCNAFCQNKYKLLISLVSKDSQFTASTTAITVRSLGIDTLFNNITDCKSYVQRLPGNMAAKGFAAASVDSAYFDSLFARVQLYTGPQFSVIRVSMDSVERKALDQAGYKSKEFNGNKNYFEELQNRQQNILNYYQNTGYPFAEVKLDGIEIDSNKFSARMKVNKGVLYHIDSIRVYGKGKIKNLFLQHYLDIKNGSIYNNEKLQNVSKRLRQLPYLREQQPFDVSMLGTGSTVNLYLQPKPSSQFNVLIGFLPGDNITGKTQLTGDVNLDLKNALGKGETILLNWQQLQRQSPRLNLGYQHPYIFNSSFGVTFAFDLLKRDSSYLQLNAQFGLQYILSANQSGKIFIQNYRSYLLQGGFDTGRIKVTKVLPPDIDINSNSVGIDYEWINTDYRFNPLKGNEVRLVASVGVKKISKNNDITSLKDAAMPAFDYNSLYDSIKLKAYQVRFVASGAHYFTTGKKTVLKTSVSAGVFKSSNIFRNELFQIGGYRLLRGFSEESIYASQYAVFTAEYRLLVGTNSFLFGFTDVGFTKTQFQSTDFSNNFQGAGIGLTFETRFGLLNISYAIGKRNDIKFDIRNSSKIHFGYINYF